MANFAERIRTLRSEQNITQDALGKIVGVKRYSVYGLSLIHI